MAISLFATKDVQTLGMLEAVQDVGSHSDSELPTAAIPIPKNKLVKFGRNDIECDIVLSHPSISGIHCMVWAIRFDDDSVPMCYVKDCSLNGILLNGRTLRRGQSCLLQDEDIITIPNIGKYRFVAKVQLISSGLLEQLGFQKRVEDWEITPRIVGSGTFGHVLVATRTENSSSTCPINYAVKVIKMKPNKLDREAQILLKLAHPNIIKVHKTFIGSKDNLYIFQDLVSGGDLFSYLARTDCLSAISETESLIIIYQILQALKYLHEQGIVHRDLKLDNILLCTPEPCTRIVLADFGIAKDLSSTCSRMHTVVGTPEYCAPEVGFKADRAIYKEFSRAATLDHHGYDAKCDLWSLGVITHIILTGISPFYGDGSEGSIIQNAKLGKLNFEAKQWIKVSENAKNFVCKLLETNVIKRLSSDGALNHVWIAKHRGQLEKIYHKKILQGEIVSLSGKDLDWKRKLPKSVVLSPINVQKRKAKKSY